LNKGKVALSLICILVVSQILIAFPPSGISFLAYGQTANGENFRPSFVANGNNSFDVGDSSTLRIATFSLAAWFKTSANYAENAVIVNKGGFGSDSSGKNMNYGIWMNSAEQVVAGFETSTGTDHFVTSPNNYSDGAWHYAVVTKNGTTLILYIDGAEVARKAASSTPDKSGKQPLRVGANSQQKNLYFTGQIDEVRLWKRSLTAQEIAAQFSSSTFNTTDQLRHLNMSLLFLINGDYFYQLREAIQNAKTNIFIAMYLVEYQPGGDSTWNNILLNDIVDAKERGVDVRFILGNIDRYPDTDNFLTANGIPFKTGASHAKIAIIDNVLFVGTHNLNRRALEFNKEQSIMTAGSGVISEVKTFYTNWWNNGTPKHVTTDLSKSEAFLSSSEYFNALNSMFGTATTRIKVNMYLIDYNPSAPTSRATILMEQLKNARDRGVDVQILIDDHTQVSYPKTIEFLEANNMNFKLDELVSPTIDVDKPGIDHSKLVIIDNVVFVGGRNWKNDLDSGRIPDYMTRNTIILSQAVKYFDAQWILGRTVN
jgi:phosphatidylserine/phosphatidylglycerophosphate/cardiolipin synthase-like enzyme